MVRLVDPIRRPTPNYFTRREQWRLLMLILPLGLVIVLMAQLRDPETADRVNSFFADPPQPESIKRQPAIAESETAKSTEPPPTLFPGIRSELLTMIKDSTYFRNAEKDAWFHFIALLQATSPAEFGAAPSINAGYVQLVGQPNSYRGTLVTVSGHLRQITKQKPAANKLGLESYYRAVIQPADGVQWPIIVYCLELPPGLSEGDNLAAAVRVSGLFFKKLSYPWQDGLGTAPVIISRGIEVIDSLDMKGASRHQPAAVDVRTNEQLKATASSNHAGDFARILALAGWDAQRLAKFDDGGSLSDAQRAQALELLRRLRTFDAASLDGWSRGGPSVEQLLSDPDENRAKMVRLAGHVTKVAKHSPTPASAERLEMNEYFACEVAVDAGAGIATVLTSRVPQAWLEAELLNEPITAAAIYLKRLPAEDDVEKSLWLAKELAWHPTAVNEPLVSFGKAVLGRFGMDVHLLDSVRSRGRISATEREAFYQMLDAAGRADAARLIRLAHQNLTAVAEAWKKELRVSNDEARRALAREVVRRADEGRYSVAPLFNNPQHQIGRLIVVDGVVRRAIRVHVGPGAGGGPSDVARRFGIEHYYELQVFTDDSQNYPLVFCVRDLPAGFPTGSSLHVPVRVAGFFFKDWLYRTRRPESGDSAAGGDSTAGRAQYAPLLIGRAPVVLTTEQGGAGVAQYVASGIFLLALAGVWAAATWYARGDRRFRERILTPRFSPPTGQSLNALKVPEDDAR